jgi:hypothetical protein
MIEEMQTVNPGQNTHVLFHGNYLSQPLKNHKQHMIKWHFSHAVKIMNCFSMPQTRGLCNPHTNVDKIKKKTFCPNLQFTKISV